jgi:hypothetical protein
MAKRDKIIKTNGNGHQEIDMVAIAKMMSDQQTLIKELHERLEYVEKNKDKTGEALLQMINHSYNTPDDRMSEMTRIPIQAARPLAYAEGLDSVLHRKKDGKSLSERIRLNYYHLMRSVGGVHLGRSIRLAEDQASAAAEDEEYERHPLGDD